jgi:hypothetical protein
MDPIPVDILRQIVFAFDEGNRSTRFAMYTKNGGKYGKNNHNTQSGLMDTISEALECPPERWIECDHKNPYYIILCKEKLNGHTTTLMQKIFDYYKPLLARSPFETVWLSADEIEHAISYQTKDDKQFCFLGAFDADDKRYLNNIIAGIGSHARDTYGLVLNIGRHWVAMLFDNKNKIFEYFDSMNHPLSHEGARRFAVATTMLLKWPIPSLEYYLNPKDTSNYYKWYLENMVRQRKTKTKTHQKEGDQCGVYCIWYITSRVHGRSLSDIHKRRMSDEKMVKLRRRYFRKSKRRYVSPSQIVTQPSPSQFVTQPSPSRKKTTRKKKKEEGSREKTTRKKKEEEGSPRDVIDLT